MKEHMRSGEGEGSCQGPSGNQLQRKIKLKAWQPLLQPLAQPHCAFTPLKVALLVARTSKTAKLSIWESQ